MVSEDIHTSEGYRRGQKDYEKWNTKRLTENRMATGCRRCSGPEDER